VERLLGRLPEGVTEMYFHPATRRCPEIDRHMPEYRHEAELEALRSPVVARALEAAKVSRIAFRDLNPPGTPGGVEPEAGRCSE
jgi:hypothetical protein